MMEGYSVLPQSEQVKLPSSAVAVYTGKQRKWCTFTASVSALPFRGISRRVQNDGTSVFSSPDLFYYTLHPPPVFGSTAFCLLTQ